MISVKIYHTSHHIMIKQWFLNPTLSLYCSLVLRNQATNGCSGHCWHNYLTFKPLAPPSMHFVVFILHSYTRDYSDNNSVNTFLLVEMLLVMRMVDAQDEVFSSIKSGQVHGFFTHCPWTSFLLFTPNRPILLLLLPMDFQKSPISNTETSHFVPNQAYILQRGGLQAVARKQASGHSIILSTVI